MRASDALAAGVLSLAACSSGRVADRPAPSPAPILKRSSDSPVAAGSGEPTVGAVEGGLMGSRCRPVARTTPTARSRSRPNTRRSNMAAPGSRRQWQARKGDNRGEIKVGTTYQVNRLDCREYTHNVWIGGRLQGRARHGLPAAGRGVADRRLEIFRRRFFEPDRIPRSRRSPGGGRPAGRVRDARARRRRCPSRA